MLYFLCGLAGQKVIGAQGRKPKWRVSKIAQTAMPGFGSLSGQFAAARASEKEGQKQALNL